jgi:hypothetical protein
MCLTLTHFITHYVSTMLTYKLTHCVSTLNTKVITHCVNTEHSESLFCQAHHQIIDLDLRNFSKNSKKLFN